MKLRRSIRIPARAMRLVSVGLAVAVLVGILLVASSASAAPLVVIDAGHGGPYNHARYGSLTEKAANLLFALELGSQLQASGYRVAYTRTSDTAVGMADIPTWHWIDAESRWLYAPDGIVWYSDGVPRDDLQARANVANDLGADIFISIHCNGAASTRAKGTENWASANDPLGQALGSYVQYAVLEITRQHNRGAGVQSFYVTKWSNMPALLIETGFMSNPTEGSQIASAGWRRSYVTGIVNGLNRWMATNPFRQLYPRYSGGTRSSTAVAASRAQWPGGAPTVILSSLYDPVSAYAAPLATTRLEAPILFADTKGLSPEVTAELARLHPSRIIALGSTKMLPESFLAQAASAAGIDVSAVTRMAGTEPADVAPMLSETMISSESSLTVVFASAGRTSDAMSAASIAAPRNAALILTRADGSLPPGAVAFLAAHSEEITATVSVGPVPEATLQDLPNRTRIGGGEPSITSIASFGVTRPAGTLGLFPYSTASPTDAVVASTVAIRAQGVALPIDGRVMSPYTREWLENVYPRVQSVTMVGDFGTLPTLADYMIDKTLR